MSDRITAEKKGTLITRQLEIDLRKWVEYEILNVIKLKDCINEKSFNFCKEQCYQRKKVLNERIVDQEISDSDLVEFIDFSTSLSILYSKKDLLNKESQEILLKIKDDLDNINPIRNDAIHGRTLLANQYQLLEDFCEKISEFEKIFIGTITEYKNLESGIIDDEDFDFSETDERNKNHNLPKEDYKDTGFIERKEINAQIKRKINNHNVISFIGDAGAGKTAFAIRKCYDFLIEKDKQFEVILYHSFKTETFSKGEVVELQNDINTSEKFFKKSLNIDNLDEDPIKNLVKYLENNKVLLFLDNLENVLDSNIIKFLDLFSEAEHQSKIFITSRIPINHGDIPIKIGSFTDKEAVDYFQRLCRFLQLKELQKSLNEKEIKKLVNKRNNNPLYVKLALNAVSENFTLDEAFKEDKDLLNYSYLNIYKTLKDNGKRILEVLYYLKKELNLSTICDLLKNVSPEIVKTSLRELTRKNFVSTSYKQSQIEYYVLRKEVVPFLNKNKFFSNTSNQSTILKEYSKFKAFESHIKINIKDLPDKIPENWNSFLCRKDSDRMAIHRLRKIKTLIGNKIFSGKRVEDRILSNMLIENETEIQTIIEELKKTHPDFCEVYRVEAVYHTRINNTEGVINGFEKAINLQPNYVNLYNYYSDCLSKINETEKFLENTKKTLEKFPNNDSTKLYRLLAKMWTNQFDEESASLYKEIDKMIYKDLGIQYKRKIGMRLLRYHMSKSQIEIENKKYDDAFLSLKRAFKKFFDLESRKLVDNYTIDQLKKAKRFNIEPLMNVYRGNVRIKELMIFNMNIHDAIGRVAQEVTFRTKRAFPKDKISGLITKYDLKYPGKIPPGFMIKIKDRYILDKGEEKKEVFLPKVVAKACQLKLNDEISFTLEEVRNKKGFMTFVAQDIVKLTN